MEWVKDFDFYDFVSPVKFRVVDNVCMCTFIGFRLEIASHNNRTSVIMRELNDTRPIFDLHMRSLIDISSKDDIEQLFALCVETCSHEKGVRAYETH